MATVPGAKQRLARLILTGFMGAGKSTVGAILGRRLGWRFIDLDHVIEASSNRSIAEIFRDQGEAGFRRLEWRAVEQLSTEKQIVLALGGGTVEDASTLRLLLSPPENCMVFLDAPLPDLLARCSMEGKVRPLLASPESLQSRHSRRLPHYRGAHFTVPTAGLTPSAVADRVLEQISALWLVDKGTRQETHGS